MNYLLFNKHSLRTYNCNWANLRNRFFDFIQSDKDNLYYFQHDKNDDINCLDIKDKIKGTLNFSNEFEFKVSNEEILEKFYVMLKYFNIDCIIGLNIPYSTSKSTYLKDFAKLVDDSSRQPQLHDLLTYASINEVKICHFVDDCLELNSVDIETSKYYSTDEIDNCTYMPFIQYGAFYNYVHNKQKDIVKNKVLTAGLKYYDFSNSSERKLIHERIINLDKNCPNKFNLYYNTGNDTSNKKLLRKNAWDREIESSMFTIATPNQNEKYLSIIRFLEAISVKCIPLRPSWITSFNSALSKWPDIIEYYNRHSELTTDISSLSENINNLTKSYPQLIEELYELPSIKEFMSDRYYIKYREQFLKTTKER